MVDWYLMALRDSITFTDEWVEVDDSVRQAVGSAMERITDTRFDEEPLLAAEQELREALGFPYLLLTSSATAAAHAVFLHAREEGAVDVGLPAHVFPGIAGAALTAGLAARFVPVGPDLIASQSSYALADVPLVHFPWGDVREASRVVGQLTSKLVVLDVSHATPRVSSSLWGHEKTLAAVGSLGAGKFLSGMELGFVASNSQDFIRSIAALGAVRRTRTFDVQQVPLATKLRPHPLALAIVRAQLRRLPAKLAAHDETWHYLAPRLNNIATVRLVTSSAPSERIFWRCLLEVDALDGTPSREVDLVSQLRGRGLPVSRPEYLDEASSQVAERLQGPTSVLQRIPRRYIAMPGFVELARAGCDRLLCELEAGLQEFQRGREVR